MPYGYHLYFAVSSTPHSIWCVYGNWSNSARRSTLCVWLNVSRFLHKGFRIAGDVYKIRGYACTIFSVSLSSHCAVDRQNRLTLIALQVDSLQAIKLAHTVHGLRKLFRRHTDNLYVIDMVSGNVVLRGGDDGLAISVARTRLENYAPAPAKSCRCRSTVQKVARWAFPLHSAPHSSIWTFIAAFGWVKLFSTWR